MGEPCPSRRLLVLEAVEDVRPLLRQCSAHYRPSDPWQKLESDLDKAQATGNTANATAILQRVLSMNGLLGGIDEAAT